MRPKISNLRRSLLRANRAEGIAGCGLGSRGGPGVRDERRDAVANWCQMFRPFRAAQKKQRSNMAATTGCRAWPVRASGTEHAANPVWAHASPTRADINLVSFLLFRGTQTSFFIASGGIWCGIDWPGISAALCG